MNRYSRKHCERDDYDFAGEVHEYRSIQVNVSLRDEDVLNNNQRGIKRTRTSTGISTSDLRRNKRPRCDRYEYEDNSRDDIIDDLKRRYKAKEREMDERIERSEGENRKFESNVLGVWYRWHFLYLICQGKLIPYRLLCNKYISYS